MSGRVRHQSDMKIFLAILIGFGGIVRGDEPSTNVSAAGIMSEMLAHRALHDFSLKARLTIEHDRVEEVDVRVHNTPTETRSIYHAGKTELLIVQPVSGEARWFLRGVGELTGDNRLEKFGGSQFTFYDLGVPFLKWPGSKLVGVDRVRGRDCDVVEIAGATGQPYSKVKLWVDREFVAMLRAELYDWNEGLVRRMTITSFKRIGDVWIPRGIDVAFVPHRQALPSEEKSRLEFYEGSYDVTLPAEMFAEEKFGAAAPR
jgi:hypothetical protein